MNYLVTYTRKGAALIAAPDPATAARRARATLNAGRSESVTILDVIPETCEDCTRAVKHEHES